MDPLVGAIVAAVLFWVLKEIIAVAIFFFVVLIFGLVSNFNDVAMVIGAVVGWVLAAGWGIFAVIQTIVQIVSIIQMAAG